MSRLILTVVLASTAGCPVKNVGELESGPAVADASDEPGSGEGPGDSEGSGKAGTGDDDPDPSHTSGAGEPPAEVTAIWEVNPNGGVTLRIAYAVGFDICASIDFDPRCASVQQWGLDLDFDPPPLPGEYDLETLTGFASVLNPTEGNGCSGAGYHVLGPGTLRLDAVGDEIQGGLVDTIVVGDPAHTTDLITVDFVAPFCRG
jgi:hypothetical protein